MQKKKNLFKQNRQPLALRSVNKHNSAALDKWLPDAELPMFSPVK